MAVVAAPDLGFAVGGASALTGLTDYRACVIKHDSNGNITWMHSYPNSTWVRGLAALSNGGFLAVGQTGGAPPGNADLWIARLDAAGLVTWERQLGGPDADAGMAVRLTADGGFIVCGTTASAGTGKDAWVLRLNAAGVVQWGRAIGGVADDEAFAVVPVADGFVVAGMTRSFGAQGEDAWVLKLDAAGSLQWQKRTGGALSERWLAVDVAADGLLYLVGRTDSCGTSGDAMVAQLTADGSVAWLRSMGGVNDDALLGVRAAPTCGMYACGTYGAGSPQTADGWLVHVDGSGDLAWQWRQGGSSGEESLFAVDRTADNGLITAGLTGSFSSDALYPADAWVLRADAAGGVSLFCGVGQATTASSISCALATADTSAAWSSAPGTPSTPIAARIPQVPQSGSQCAADGGGKSGNWERVPAVTARNTSLIALKETDDGGVIGVATVSGNAIDPSEVLLLKLTPAGLLDWGVTLHEAEYLVPKAVHPAIGCSYLLCGHAGNTTLTAAGFIAKVDAGGSLLWSFRAHTPTTTGSQGLNDLCPTPDGGCTAIGSTPDRLWLLRLDGSGSRILERTLVGPYATQGFSIVSTADGGFAADGKIKQTSAGNWDWLLVRLDADLNLVWSRTLGSSADEPFGTRVQAARDGSLYCVGTSGSPTGLWLTKWSDSGSLSWQRLAPPDLDSAGLYVEPDGSPVVTWYHLGTSYDATALRFSPGGALDWATYHGSQTRTDESFAVSGHSGGSSLCGGYRVDGDAQSWVFKLDNAGLLGNVACSASFSPPIQSPAVLPLPPAVSMSPTLSTIVPDGITVLSGNVSSLQNCQGD